MVVGRVFASGWTMESGQGFGSGGGGWTRDLWGVGLGVCGGLDSGFVGGGGGVDSCSTDFVH